MSDNGDKAKGGCGCLVLGAIVLIVIGLANNNNNNKAGLPPSQVPPAQAPPASSTEPALKEFSQKHVPELHAAIEQIDAEVTDRSNRCDQLATTLRQLNRDPLTDPDYVRWQDAVKDMRAHANALRKDREEAYIAYKKFELAPKGDRTEYTRVLAKARQAAVDSREYHRKMQERLEAK